MLRTVCTFILLIMAIPCSAQSDSKHVAHCTSGLAQSCQLKAQGDFLSQQFTGRFRAKNIFLSMTPYMDGALRLYQRKDGKAIQGEFLFDNHARKPVLIKYQVVFKDRKGSIARTTGHLLLKQGNKRKINFSDIVLSKQELNNISSYEIVLNKAR